MTRIEARIALDVDGSAAPPRVNGELVFETPWEGRAFGLVMALCNQQVIEWETFRAQLIAAIARWENAPEPKAAWSYYSCWLNAAECVLTQAGLLEAVEIDALYESFLQRPHGHDHQH